MALILLLLLTSTAAAKPTPPSYPQSYSVLYNFTLPYLKEVQPDGLTYVPRLDGAYCTMSTHNNINTSDSMSSTYVMLMDSAPALKPMVGTMLR